MSAAHDSLAHVWTLAQALPPPERIELAQRLLSSVAPKPAERSLKPADLIGDLRVSNPPDDEEVERILEEARMQKYG